MCEHVCSPDMHYSLPIQIKGSYRGSLNSREPHNSEAIG
jgi:hypothetical protein